MNNAAIEADEHEHDSTFGGDHTSLASSTASILSAATKYQFEHGRRYHGYEAGKYVYPNDEKELDRQDLEHRNQLIQMDGKLFLCPLAPDPKAILDLGTGTGIWCIDIADAYPNCEVIGTDLSPVQPAWVPPNCKFEIDDWDKQWTFGSNRFDMVHLRFAIGSIKDYPLLYKRVLDALKPGGSFQIVEVEMRAYSDDGTLADDSALVLWGELMHEAFDKMKVTVPMAEDYEELLRGSGFENVETMIMKRPMNDWPKDPRMKEIGKYCCLNWLEGVEGFTLAPFTRFLGWSPEEVNIFIAKIRKESVTRRIHAYHKGLVCWGLKPVRNPQA